MIRLAATLIALFLLAACSTTHELTLDPETIITTPEGAYIIDVLWLNTDQPLPPFPEPRTAN